MTGSVIEGVWGDFEFKMIHPQDIPSVLEHLKKAFYPDETMFSIVGYTGELGDEVNLVVEHFLKKDASLSFIAIHTPTRKVAGVRITNHHDNTTGRPDVPVNLEVHKNILGFMGEVAGKIDLLDRYGVDSCADLFMTSVDPEFRQRGLVTEMYARSLTLIKTRGYTLAESFFSSPHTRRAASKSGFEEIDRAYYFDAVDEHGHKRFPKATPDQFVARMIRVF